MLNFRDQIKRQFDNRKVESNFGIANCRLTNSAIEVEFDYNESLFTIKGPISNTDLNGCYDSRWTISYRTELTYDGSIAIMGFDCDDNHLYLDLSDCTRVVVGLFGVIGREFPDKSEFSRYFDEALDRLGTELNKKLVDISNSIMDLRLRFSTVYSTVEKLKQPDTVPTESTVWIVKNDQRIKVHKDDLDKFIQAGYKVSPKKEKKTTTTKRSNLRVG